MEEIWRFSRDDYVKSPTDGDDRNSAKITNIQLSPELSLSLYSISSWWKILLLLACLRYTHTVYQYTVSGGWLWSEQKLEGRTLRPFKNWEVGASDLSKTERSDAPTFQKLRGRPLLAHNSETISQNHIKFGVSRVNILDYSVINFQVNRTYPSRVIAVGSW